MSMKLIGPVYLIGGQDYNRVYVDWPANDANVYLVDTGDTLVMVDCGCGDSLFGIMDNVKRSGLDVHDLSHLLLTHAHFPHAAAAEAVRRNGAKVFASAEATEAVESGDVRTAAYHYHREFPACEEVVVVDDGQVIEVGATKFEVIALPGHSPGCVGYCVSSDEGRLLFCGDAVRSPLLDSFRNRLDYDRAAYAESLKKLLDSPPEVLYPGHGPFCLSNAHVWIEEELKKVLAHS